MKLLLDANLSPEVSRHLAEAGHDTIHVAEIEMVSATDPEILAAAAQTGARADQCRFGLR